MFQYLSLSFLWRLFLVKLRVWFTDRTKSGLLRSVDSKTYELAYYHGLTPYVVRFPKSRGPSRIQMITSKKKGIAIDDAHSQSTNVTDQVRMYMGPANNFHGIPTTPSSLGYANALIFTMMDGSERTFELSDIIKL